MTSSLWQDIRFGARILLRKPGMTAVAVITLALGIGANTAIFSVTDKLLIRSLPVRDPQQLVLINSISVNPYFVGNAFSYPDFKDYREQNDVFSGLLVFSKTDLELRTNDETERVSSEYVSSNYFDVLGVSAARGRTFSTDQDDTPGSQQTVMVGYDFWQTRFGGDLGLIGRTITLNNVPLTVIGISPRGFSGMVLERPTELWVPVSMHPQLAQSKFIQNRKDRWMLMLGRVKAGVSRAQAEKGLDLLAQHIKEANAPPGAVTKGLPFSEQHIHFEPGGAGISILRKKFATPLKLLLAVVGLVLLIACANVAGLLLARGEARRREMAIRLAVGASGWRLTRQLLTESLLLAIAGGGAGLLLAPWLVSMLVRTQARLDVAQSLLGEGVDGRVLAFNALTTLLTGVVFGIVPAWIGSKASLVPALKEEGGFSGPGSRRSLVRSALVVGQLALAVVVLIGAGLCIKSLRNLLAIDPGYHTDNLLIIPVDFDETKYDRVRGEALQRQLRERLSTLPGVRRVSYGLVMPLSGSRAMSSLYVQDRQPRPDEQLAFDTSTVGPDYHEAMGIQMVQGRGFTDQDREGAPRVVIINEALARRLFPGENALGKRLKLGTGDLPLEVVGITRDIKYHDLTEEPLPHFDLPALQRGYNSYISFVVSIAGPAADVVSGARSELRALGLSGAESDVTTMSAEIGNALAAMRLASTLIGAFGVVALSLASIGLYGVLSWTVSRRTREIGIRMALGAESGDVVRLVLRQGTRLTAAGLVFGLAAAFAGTRLIESLLYGVGRSDAWTFVEIGVLLAAVALLACWIPARRAAKVDPMIALRYE